MKTPFSKALQEKIETEQMAHKIYEHIHQLSFINFIVYYVINSKFRRSVHLQNWIKKQIGNETIEALGKKFRKILNVDDRMKAILKHWRNGYGNLDYVGDKTTYGTNEYWATVDEILEKKKDDCIEENELIICYSNEEGYYHKKIKDIVVGEHVMSYNFKEQKLEDKQVLRVINKGKKPVNEYRVNGQYMFKATDNHIVFDKLGNEIYIKDILKKQQRDKQILNLKSLNNISNNSNLNHDDMFLIGQYLSEGWKCGKRVYLSGDDYGLQEHIKNLFKRNNIKYSQSNRRKHAYFEILDKEYKKLLSQFGNNAFKKTIPSYITKLDKSFLETLYFSFIIGDGYFDKNKKNGNYGWCTSSTKLKDDLLLISMLIDKVPIIYYQRKHGGFGNKPIWRAEYNFGSHRRNEKMNNLCSTSIGFKKYCGFMNVYDIEVEDNHNFILSNGTLVHNCDGFMTIIYLTAKASGISDYRIYCVAGLVEGGAHAYVIYRANNGLEFPIDGSYWPNTSYSMKTPYFLRKSYNYGETEWWRFNASGSYKTS